MSKDFPQLNSVSISVQDNEDPTRDTTEDGLRGNANSVNEATEGSHANIEETMITLREAGALNVNIPGQMNPFRSTHHQRFNPQPPPMQP